MLEPADVEKVNSNVSNDNTKVRNTVGEFIYEEMLREADESIKKYTTKKGTYINVLSTTNRSIGWPFNRPKQACRAYTENTPSSFGSSLRAARLLNLYTDAKKKAEAQKKLLVSLVDFVVEQSPTPDMPNYTVEAVWDKTDILKVSNRYMP